MVKPCAMSAASASPVNGPPDDQRNTQPAQQPGPPFKRHTPHAAIGRGVDSAGTNARRIGVRTFACVAVASVVEVAGYVVVGLVAGSEAGCTVGVAGDVGVVSRPHTDADASQGADRVQRAREYGCKPAG